MKHLLITLALLVANATAWAQKETKTSSPASMMARAEQAIYGGGAREAEFTSSYLDTKGRLKSSISGSITLSGEKFRLTYGHITAVYSNKTLTHYDKTEHSLTTSNPSPEELLQINPLFFLRSRGRGFKVSVENSNATADILAYIPEGKSNIKQISITFLKSSGLPSAVSARSLDGSRIFVKIDALRAVSEPGASYFELRAKDYPGAEIIDLR